MQKLLLFIAASFLFSCSSSDDNTNPPAGNEEDMYFPENNTDAWEIKSLTDLGWDEAAKADLLTYLEEKHTKSFIILQNGRIVVEEYFNGHSATTPWYWASAGKTLTATVTGIAQQEGHLNLTDKVSNHLGTGWTSAPLAKENLITVRHLLTMTSGLDDAMGDDVSPGNLQYVADAGTRWAYHNVYVKLQDVVAEASGQTWDDYFTQKLKTPIGMSGAWVQTGNLSVYWSTARSMARFGLLALNKGKWKESQVVENSYFTDATHTSQNINKGYGYLWWINGEESYHLPQSQATFPGSVIPTGFEDMYMGLGKNDQKVYVIPSKKMVVIRMGEVADGENFAVSDFDPELWTKIRAMVN